MKRYDKRDDFNFLIVNFPIICSNITAAPAYGVYISQLIRYSRACGFHYDFLNRWMLLIKKLLNQWFLVVKLKSSLLKFYGRHHDLVNRYEAWYVPLVVIAVMSFPHSWLTTKLVTRLTRHVPRVEHEQLILQEHLRLMGFFYDMIFYCYRIVFVCVGWMFLRYDGFCCIILLSVLTVWFYDMTLHCCLCWLYDIIFIYCCLCWLCVFMIWYYIVICVHCVLYWRHDIMLFSVLTLVFLWYDVILLSVLAGCFLRYDIILLFVLTGRFLYVIHFL